MDITRFWVPFERGSMEQLFEWFISHGCTSVTSRNRMFGFAKGDCWQIDMLYGGCNVAIDDGRIAALFALRWM